MAGWHPTLAQRADMLRATSRGGLDAVLGPDATDVDVVRYAIANQAHGDSGFGANLVQFAEIVGMAELGVPTAGQAIPGFADVLPPPTALAEEAPVDDWDLGDFDWGDVGDVMTGDVGGIDWNLGDIDLSGAGNAILREAIGGGGGGGGGGGTAVVTQAGAFGGAAAMGAGVALRSLWGVLRAGGSRLSTFVINGVRGRMTDLWPAVRKYGPQAVAVALGIGADQLAQLLMQAPTQGGRRRRGRGISAADIRRAKRVIRFNKQLSRQLGTGGGRGYSRRGSSRRPRWVRVDGY